MIKYANFQFYESKHLTPRQGTEGETTCAEMGGSSSVTSIIMLPRSDTYAPSSSSEVVKTNNG